jgi:hypothetical protein
MGRPIERYYHKPTATAPRDRPWVTVVVPTYNNTQGLMAALQSVYSQVFRFGLAGVLRVLLPMVVGVLGAGCGCRPQGRGAAAGVVFEGTASEQQQLRTCPPDAALC